MILFKAILNYGQLSSESLDDFSTARILDFINGELLKRIL